MVESIADQVCRDRNSQYSRPILQNRFDESLSCHLAYFWDSGVKLRGIYDAIPSKSGFVEASNSVVCMLIGRNKYVVIK
jgi:hypothetical protein